MIVAGDEQPAAGQVCLSNEMGRLTQEKDCLPQEKCLSEERGARY